MLRFKSSIIILCLLTMSISSCKKDSSEEQIIIPDTIDLSPQLTATIDGVAFEADESLIGSSLTFPNGVHQLVVSGSNQIGVGQVTIQVYFMDLDFENFVDDAEFVGNNIVGVNYFLGKVDRLGLDVGEGSSFTTQEAHGIITSINTDLKVMSGSFTFTALNEDETESEVTEGYFEDIAYD